MAKIRKDATGYGWRDFYGLASDKYDFGLCGSVARGQVDYATLRTLTAWDGDVEEILRGYVFLPNLLFG